MIQKSVMIMSINVTIELTNQMFDRLRAILGSDENSPEKCILKAVEEYLRIYDEYDNDPFFSLPNIAGSSGESDISINHDKILYDKE